MKSIIRVAVSHVRAMSQRKVWAAVCQMNATNDRDKNVTICYDLISQAAKSGARMVFLPECFDYVGSNRDESVKMAETLDGPTIERFKNIALKHQVWLSLGGFHEKCETEEKIYISHVVLNAKGEVVCVYRKTHLFDVNTGENSLMESSYTKKGGTILPPVDTPIGKIGLQICYDLRFPEVSLVQRHQGADILTYPSAFTVPTGMAHWHLLLRARAVENQCYVIAAAQTGKHNSKRESYGHALIVDPWGTIVCECSEGNTFSMTEIDLDLLEKVRTRMPVSQHRRYDLYNKRFMYM